MQSPRDCGSCAEHHLLRLHQRHGRGRHAPPLWTFRVQAVLGGATGGGRGGAAARLRVRNRDTLVSLLPDTLCLVQPVRLPCP